MLELLGAYDGSGNPEFLNTAEEFSAWIMTASEQELQYDIRLLNDFQIKKRRRDLTTEEETALVQITEDRDALEPIKVGAYLLLNQQTAARIHFERLKPNEQRSSESTLFVDSVKISKIDDLRMYRVYEARWEGKSLKQEKSKFELLRSKSIIAILDGDKDFGPFIINGVDSGIKISMPYLSGPMLCTISNNWGLPATYDRNGGAKSRWEYLDDLLVHCIRNNRGSDLLAFLFSKQQFEDKLKGRTATEVESAYKQIVTTIIDQINGELCFGGNELIKTGAVFMIRKSGTSVILATPTIKLD